MEIQKIHKWDLNPKEAVELQKTLVDRLIFKPLNEVRTVAAVDISCSKHDPRLFAAVIVMDLVDMLVIETSTAIVDATFPYLTGLLAFREIPALIQAFEKLVTIPDVVLCDGQGIAHPRGVGIASHLGLWIDIPTIGCGKTRLVGEYGEIGESQWCRTPLIFKKQVVGSVVRTKKSIRPLFISPGHLIDLKSSLEILQKCVTRYRLPEPIRLAHLKVNQIRLAS